LLGETGLPGEPGRQGLQGFPGPKGKLISEILNLIKIFLFKYLWIIIYLVFYFLPKNKIHFILGDTGPTGPEGPKGFTGFRGMPGK